MGTYAREKNRSLKYTVLWSIITGPTLRKQKNITYRGLLTKVHSNCAQAIPNPNPPMEL